MNVRNIHTAKPAFGMRRRNADGEVVDKPAKVPFDWNNLVTTLGSSISSIFGGLTASKQLEMNQQYQYSQNRQNNSLLWIGLVVIAIIVIGLIVFLRKK